jgi:hypothetical protein
MPARIVVELVCLRERRLNLDALADFAAAAKDLVELAPIIPFEILGALDPVYAPDRIQATPFAMTVGYDRVKARSLPAYLTVSQRLDAWKASSPVVVQLIRTALDGMDWVFTPYRQEICHLETIPGRFGRDTLYSAVVYNERFGARMSLPVVNQMGHTSLSGLLVHEALRHVSIAYQDGLSDETLRRVTAKILLSNPGPGETLDHVEWYGNVVGGMIAARLSHLALFDKVCALLQAHGRADSRLCVGDKAIAQQLVIASPGGSEERSAYQQKLFELDDALVDIAMRANPASGEERADLNQVLEARGEMSGLMNEFIADGFNSIIPGMVDATHSLNNVFVGMTEDELHRYLSGGHSGVGLFDRIKLNSAISKAQDENRKALQGGTILSCPAG